MSKNKIAKLLLALGIGVATVASGVAVAGCNPENGGGTPSGSEQTQKHTVKFDLNGATGTAPDSKQVDEGSKVSKPNDPSWSGHNFDGWYTAATGGTKWNFDSDKVSEDITLYAHWTDSQQGGEVTADGTLAVLTKDNCTAFGEGDEITGVVYNVKADKKVVLNVPTGAGECYLVAVPQDAFANEGQSTKTFSIKIGANTVAYSMANNWGYPTSSAEPVDFSGITTIEVTATENVTIHIALAPKTLFESEGPGGETEYEDVVSAVDFAAEKGSGSTRVLEDDITFGKITTSGAKGCQFETSSSIVCFKWSAGDLYFSVRGAQNTVTMQARSGSDKGAGIKLLKVTTPAAEGQAEVTEELKQWGGTVASGKWIPATGDTSAEAAEDLTMDLEAGTYKLVRMNNVRLSKFEVLEKLPKGTPTSITVTGATRDYVVGDTFSSEGLNTTLVYDNDRQDIVTATSVDSTAVDMSKSGAYDVTVKYTEPKSGNEFTTTYTVYVYKVDSITANTDRISTSKPNSAAGNGIYFNEAMQEFYFVGDQLNNDGLSATLHCSVEGVEGKTKDFYDRTFTIALQEGQDMNSAGKKTVILKAYNYTQELSIYVAAKADFSNVSEVNISVDSKTAENEIGTLVSGTYKFASIQQALDFLEMLDLNVTVKKTITLAAETYEEKVEVTVPNLTIKGTKTGSAQSTIEYDSLLGLLDPSGFMHVTDSTATLAVRDTAEGFTLDGVIVNNKYSTQSYFDEQLGKNYGEHRALAVLIMADKVIIKDCQLNGYQDTIELFKGRQLIQNTLITGLTDFIFGTNNTTYFEECEIRTIKADRNAADRTGLKDSTAHGGYITAFKGNNKDANDCVKYGAIFVGCNFTAEDGVADGLMAIGRPWGAYAKVAVIECTLGKHIATTSSGTASQDERYVTMSGNAPTLTTVEFREYKNTGDSKIDAEVAGMKFLSDDEAAQYKNKSVVFGTTNGKVTYDDVWTGEAITVYTLTIKSATDETIYTGEVTGGTILSKGELSALVPKEQIPDGQMIDEFYTDSNLQTVYNYAAVSGNVTVYVKFINKPEGLSAEYNAESSAVDYSLRDNCPIDVKSGEYVLYTIKEVTGGDIKVAEHSATASDDSGRKFTKCFLPGGSKRVIVIDVKMDIKLTVYFTVTNSSWADRTTAIKWTITRDGVAQAAQTGAAASTPSTATAQVIELKAGDSVALQCNDESNRFVVYGLYAATV